MIDLDHYRRLHDHLQHDHGRENLPAYVTDRELFDITDVLDDIHGELHADDEVPWETRVVFAIPSAEEEVASWLADPATDAPDHPAVWEALDHTLELDREARAEGH